MPGSGDVTRLLRLGGTGHALVTPASVPSQPPVATVTTLQRYSGTRHAPREEMTSRYVTTMSHVLVTSYCCSQLLWLLWQGLAAATKESSAALL